ncbi:MAG: hypothetical protein M0022_00690 [Desulfobacteraceae bacterium]|nr:hypothetical protein [Desulfobacteraceae bacterium]
MLTKIKTTKKLCERCGFPCRKRELCWYCHKREEARKPDLSGQLTFPELENNERNNLTRPENNPTLNL